MHRAYTYRLWTKPRQEEALSTMLETSRRLYNEALGIRQEVYDKERKTVGFIDQTNWFTTARKNNPFYLKLPVFAAHGALKRLDKAMQAFFRRCRAGEKPGYPRFKGRAFYDSIEFANFARGGINLKPNNRLYVQHVGDVRINLHRPLPEDGKIKTAVIKREAGKWYVTFFIELPDVEPVSQGHLPSVGIDVGLENFLTTSRGEFIPNPRYLQESLAELRVAQRSVSRKKKGGANRKKAIKKVAKIHAHIRNVRKEHHSLTALALVKKHGLIAVEKLNIRGMLSNSRLARSISDVGWGKFLLTLKGKCETHGVKYVEVNPRGTSQQCSGCDAEVKKDLSVRVHACPGCGLVLHRDVNAARNILARGLVKYLWGEEG